MSNLYSQSLEPVPPPTQLVSMLTEDCKWEVRCKVSPWYHIEYLIPLPLVGFVTKLTKKSICKGFN